MLKSILAYCDDNKKIHFAGLMINGEPFKGKIEDIDIGKSNIEIKASGPYGIYSELNDLEMFREMAEMTPSASFEAEISGNEEFIEQNLKCILKNGLLSIESFYKAYEEEDIAWCKDFMKKLPYGKFKKLFKVSGEDFDKDAYAEIVDAIEGDYYDTIDALDYDDFVSYLEDYDAETKLDEEKFVEIMEEKIPELGIVSPEEFAENYNGGVKKVMTYDPVKKEYI